MICPHCGAELPDSANFCRECGTSLAHAQETATPEPVRAAEPEPEPEPRKLVRRRARQKTTATVAPEPSRKRGLNKGKTFIAITFAVCIAVGVIAAVALNLLLPEDASTPTTDIETPEGEHPITFYMNAEGYGEGGTRIPIQITGSDSKGNDVNKVIYLAYSGVDTTLPPGQYVAEVVGSPIASDGTLYDYDLQPASFTVSEELDEDEGYTVEESRHFALASIDPSEVTDDQINDAVEWARKDEGLDEDVDIDELAELARANRDKAMFLDDDNVSA